MSATMRDLKQDINKDPDELKREADQARGALEDTLYLLEQRLSPSAIVDRVMTAVKENGGEFGTNLLAQVRNNPVPTVLSSVGVAWLMASSKRPPPRTNGGRPSVGERWSSGVQSARDSAREAGDAMRNAADAASSAYQSAADTASSAYRAAADTTADAANRVVDTTRATAGRVARASRGSAQAVAECYTYLRAEQPLVLGAIAIVAGAAIGALLPTTSAESEWMGDASQAARERLEGEARRRMDDVKEGVERATEAARQSAGETSADARDEQRPGG
jgi:hypothetical protein